jgi:hypothetical protein
MSGELKKCPFLGGDDCLGSMCAVYDVSSHGCAMAQMYLLDTIRVTLEEVKIQVQCLREAAERLERKP